MYVTLEMAVTIQVPYLDLLQFFFLLDPPVLFFLGGGGCI